MIYEAEEIVGGGVRWCQHETADACPHLGLGLPACVGDRVKSSQRLNFPVQGTGVTKHQLTGVLQPLKEMLRNQGRAGVKRGQSSVTSTLWWSH